MERQPHATRIGIVAAREPIAQLLEAYLQHIGWSVVRIAPSEAVDGTRLLACCRLVLCDLDLHAAPIDAVRATGVPLIYFSASRHRAELDLPTDGPFLDFPPNRETLEKLIRSFG